MHVGGVGTWLAVTQCTVISSAYARKARPIIHHTHHPSTPSGPLALPSCCSDVIPLRWWVYCTYVAAAALREAAAQKRIEELLGLGCNLEARFQVAAGEHAALQQAYLGLLSAAQEYQAQAEAQQAAAVNYIGQLQRAYSAPAASGQVGVYFCSARFWPVSSICGCFVAII